MTEIADPTPPPPPPSPPPSPPRKRTGCLQVGLIVGGIIFGLMVLGAIVGDGQDKSHGAGSGQVETVARVPDVEVTAQQLSADYQDNEMRAQQVYDGKMVRVSGRVAGVTLDFRNRPTVQLESGNQFMPVQVQLVDVDQPDAATLNRGDEIAVTCSRVVEVIGSPILSDCRFVRGGTQ